MKIETLHEFVILAKHLNFTKAAQELYTTQPGLSSRISAMEKTLGYPLFERSTNKVVLTPAGLILLEYAQEILSTYAIALKKAERTAKNTPPVRITSIAPSSEYYQILPDPHEILYTFVDLDLNTTAIDALQKKTVDIAIETNYTIIEEFKKEAEELGITYHDIGEEACTICMMTSHELASKKALSRQDLEGQNIVIHSGSHFDRWSKMVQWMIGKDVNLTFRMNTLETMSNLSMIDLGDSIYICGSDVPHRLLAPRKDIATFNLLDNKSIASPTALICRTEDLENESSEISKFYRYFLGAWNTNS